MSTYFLLGCWNSLWNINTFSPAVYQGINPQPQPKANRYKLLGFSQLLIIAAKLINLHTFPFGVAMNFLLLIYADFIRTYSVCCIVVQTFQYKDHGWYIVLDFVSNCTGTLLGYSFAIIINFETYSPIVSLILISLPSFCFALAFSFYYLIKINFTTPARSLELNKPLKAKLFLDQIYSPQLSLKVMDEMQLEIDSGLYKKGRCGGLRPTKCRPFFFLVIFIFIAEVNGHMILRSYPNIAKADDSPFLLKSKQWIHFWLHIERFIWAVTALLAAWRISRKILLISGSLTMVQCWLVFYILLNQTENTQLIVILCTLSTVYKFLEIWSYKSMMFVLSFEMESMYGNIWLIGFSYFFRNGRNIYQSYDPIFQTKTQTLLFFLLNLAAFLFFLFYYKETKNRRREGMVLFRDASQNPQLNNTLKSHGESSEQHYLSERSF